jgi:hypothetical protein
MAVLADQPDGAERDPAIIRRVFDFRTMVVAASLGYPQELWPRVGDVLGAPVIERLYEEVFALSAIGAEAKRESRARLRPVRSVASGTG